MTNERKLKLFKSALNWVFYHTEGYGKEEYVNALKEIGFTEDEIKEELEQCEF